MDVKKINFPQQIFQLSRDDIIKGEFQGRLAWFRKKC